MSGFEEDDIPKTGAIALSDLQELRTLAAEKNKSACVRALSGTRLGHVYKIGEEPVTIGRSPECTIHLDEQGVSRVQLTSRTERRKAHQFYKNLGFDRTGYRFVKEFESEDEEV